MPDARPVPSLPGLAACLLALEGEARALDRPFAAHLIAAAATVLLDEPPSATHGGHQQGLLRGHDGPGTEAP